MVKTSSILYLTNSTVDIVVNIIKTRTIRLLEVKSNTIQTTSKIHMMDTRSNS